MSWRGIPPPVANGLDSSPLYSGTTGDAISQEGGLRRALLQGLAAGDTPQPCNGRTLWLVIGLLTLSSPLAILMTQARPSPKYFCSSSLKTLVWVRPRLCLWWKLPWLQNTMPGCCLPSVPSLMSVSQHPSSWLSCKGGRANEVRVYASLQYCSPALRWTVFC